MNEFCVGINEAGEHTILPHPRAHELLGNYVVAKRDVEERIAESEAIIKCCEEQIDGLNDEDIKLRKRIAALEAENASLREEEGSYKSQFLKGVDYGHVVAVRIAALKEMLKTVTDAFHSLYVAHWDTDDVQPEEQEEIVEQGALIRGARALLKEGGK